MHTVVVLKHSSVIIIISLYSVSPAIDLVLLGYLFFNSSEEKHPIINSLDLVQVVGASVVDIMEEACSYHSHYLQVGVVPLQHPCLRAHTHTTKWSKDRTYAHFCQLFRLSLSLKLVIFSFMFLF